MTNGNQDPQVDSAKDLEVARKVLWLPASAVLNEINQFDFGFEGDLWPSPGDTRYDTNLSQTERSAGLAGMIVRGLSGFDLYQKAGIDPETKPGAALKRYIASNIIWPIPDPGAILDRHPQSTAVMKIYQGYAEVPEDIISEWWGPTGELKLRQILGAVVDVHIRTMEGALIACAHNSCLEQVA